MVRNAVVAHLATGTEDVENLVLAPRENSRLPTPNLELGNRPGPGTREAAKVYDVVARNTTASAELVALIVTSELYPTSDPTYDCGESSRQSEHSARGHPEP